TRADLVVRAPGRVRPTSPPQKVLNYARGQVLGATDGSQVVAVYYRVGDKVKEGQPLVRLDTSRLDKEIALKRDAIKDGEKELAQSTELKRLENDKRQNALSVAGAQLRAAEEKIKDLEEQRKNNIDRLKNQLELAQKNLQSVVQARAAASTQEY